MNFNRYSPLGCAASAVHPKQGYELHGASLSWNHGLPIIRTDEVKLGSVIGSGGFGKVHRAMINPAGRASYEAAVKIPHHQGDNDLKQEALIFNLLQHTNILRMMGLIIDESHQNKGLVLEYCSGGPLNNWLKNNQNILTLKCSIDWSLQVAQGMEYLHKRAPAKLLHRDLKSSNVLLLHQSATVPESQILKISDFGLARARQEQRSLSQEQFSAAGTYAWMAPESIRSNNFSPYSDVWSFGVLFWEILTGEVPYRGLEPLQVAFSVAHRQLRLPIPSSIPDTLSKLMERCWAEESHQRPEFDEIKETLLKAKDEFQDYDNSGQFRSLQTTWKAEVRDMLENLKEKAGELKSKEMELVEREKAVSRRQASIILILECPNCKRCKSCHRIIQTEQDLQQRELDVVQREISVLLKEQTLESQIGHNKKKKGKKADRISSPRNLEHLVAVMNGTSGLKVSKDKENSILPVSNRPFVASDSDDFHSETRSKFFGRFRKTKVVEPEKRSKTWGPKNGEHAQRELNRHSSSTSDMDKIGKSNQKYNTIKQAINPATLLIGSIGLSRDISINSTILNSQGQHLDSPNPALSIPSNSSSSPPSKPQYNPVNHAQRVPQPPSMNFSDSSISPSPAPRNRRSTDTSISRSRDHTPLTRPTCSSPPGPECTRPRPRRPGHRRVPSEPIELGEIAHVARQLEHSNVIQKQEKLLNGTIMSSSESNSNRRTQSAGPPVNRINLMKPIPIDVRSTSGPPVANFTHQPNAIPNSSSNTNNTPLNLSHEWNLKTSPIPPKRLEMVSRVDFMQPNLTGGASENSVGTISSSVSGYSSRDVPSTSFIHIDPLNDDMIRFDPS